MAKLPPPRYTIWQALSAAIALAKHALEEARKAASNSGPPGPPGLGFDDFKVEQENERNFKFVFARGDQRKEFEFNIPVAIYRGVYREGTYERGDIVTWAGSAWLCDAEKTTEKPATKDWKLFVKRGLDGKDGKDGDRGPQGPKGDPGLNGRVT